MLTQLHYISVAGIDTHQCSDGTTFHVVRLGEDYSTNAGVELFIDNNWQRWDAIVDKVTEYRQTLSDGSHWDDDPDYPPEDWQAEVANDDTRLGYAAWVASQREWDQAQSDDETEVMPS
jgi:hypothetical protein